MPHSPILPSLLREAAEAEEAARAARSWLENHKTYGGQKPRVKLSWDAGSALDGYELIRLRVETMVETGLEALIRQAVDDLSARADERVATARALLNEGKQ